MKEMLGKYRFEWGVLPFLISFFLPWMLLNNICIGWMLLFGVGSALLKKEVHWMKLKYFIPMLGFFLLHLAGLVWTDNMKAGWMLTESRSSFVLIPVALVLINPDKKSLFKFFNWFSLMLIIIGILGLLYGFWRFYDTGEQQWIYNDNIIHVFGFQAVYFSWMANFVLVYLIQKLFVFWRIFKIRIWLIAGVVFIITLNFLLACRIPLIFMVLAIVIIIGRKVILKNTSLKYKLALSCGLILLGVTLFSVFPKTVNRFKSMFQTNFDFKNKSEIYHFNDEYDESKWTGSTLRMAIWTCSLDLISENLLIGTGTGDKMDELKRKYSERDFKYGLDKNMGVHNQYLEVYATFGILGLVLLIIIVAFPFYHFFKKRNLLGVFIVTGYSMGFMTEDIINRNQGIVFFVFILSLLLITNEYLQIKLPKTIVKGK